MPRRPVDRPWLHNASGFWCATIEGRRVYLDRDYKVAERKLRVQVTELKRRAAGANEWLDRPFAELADRYLDDKLKSCEHSTYEGYKYRLARALQILGTSVRVGAMRKKHLSELKLALTDSTTTVRDTLASVIGVFNWAVSEDLVEVNPLAGYKLPAARQRTRVATDDEIRRLVRGTAKNPSFRRVLLALRETGCRPGEVRELTWDKVDLERGLWILDKHKTIKRQRTPLPRVIPLSDVLWRLCRWLDARPHEASGAVFRNQHGKKYSKDCVTKTFGRLRTRAGIKLFAGEQLVLYSHRHTFATERAGRVTDIELAELLGHTTTRLLPRYTHFNVDRLHDIKRRAERPH